MAATTVLTAAATTSRRDIFNSISNMNVRNPLNSRVLTALIGPTRRATSDDMSRSNTGGNCAPTSWIVRLEGMLRVGRKWAWLHKKQSGCGQIVAKQSGRGYWVAEKSGEKWAWSPSGGRKIGVATESLEKRGNDHWLAREKWKWLLSSWKKVGVITK